MLTRLEDLLHRHGDQLLKDYVARIHIISETYRRRPEYELRQTARMALEASNAYMIHRNAEPIDRFIEYIIARRLPAGFKLGEVQSAFQAFRDTVRTLIVDQMDRRDINPALDLVDAYANYATRHFTERFVAMKENDILAMNQRLSAALDDLKVERTNSMAAYRLKDQFLANVSHELKTPLTGIIGFSKILMEMEGMDPKVRDKLRVIFEQGKSLLRMINTLLMISEISSGAVQVSRDAVEFRDLVDLAIQNIRKLKVAENHELVFSVTGKMPIVICDSEKMIEVIFELLLNSLKFSEPGAPVEISLRHSGDRMFFSVKDEGIGIDTAELNRIFSPFYQLDGSITRKYGGNGLGLTMIKKVVEIHKGTVTVQSNPGKGSTFTVELPLVPPLPESKNP